MEQNLVSVIIPVYNVERYLDACVASVCSQTYQNIEIILVDDGSTDRSSEICEEWAERDDRISVIHKENGGVSSARNKGLSHASGEFIYFADSDDILEPQLLQIAVSNLDEGFDIVSFGYSIIDRNGNVQLVHFPERQYDLRDDKMRVDFILGPFFRFETGWNVWNSLFRTRVIRNFGIVFYDYKAVAAEDQLFYLCYLAHCTRIKIIDRQLYQYFQRTDSLMGLRRKNGLTKVGEKNALAKILKEYYTNWTDCQCFLDVFPLIHYLVMERNIQAIEKRHQSAQSVYYIVREDVVKKTDLGFFCVDLCACAALRNVMRRNYSLFSTMGKLSRAKMMYSGHSMLYSLMLRLYCCREKLQAISKKC